MVVIEKEFESKLKIFIQELIHNRACCEEVEVKEEVEDEGDEE